ncbi:MAG: hypothetical protein ACYCSS_04105 [Sulfuriferula sp.]
MNKKSNRIAWVILSCLLSLATTHVALADGCLKGAAIGGVAGHVMGHHAVLGAAAGCFIGHHKAKEAKLEAARKSATPVARVPSASPTQ